MIEKKDGTTEAETEPLSTGSETTVETPDAPEPEGNKEKENNATSQVSEIYSNIASNRYENLRTSYIENKAKELSRKRK